MSRVSLLTKSPLSLFLIFLLLPFASLAVDPAIQSLTKTCANVSGANDYSEGYPFNNIARWARGWYTCNEFAGNPFCTHTVPGAGCDGGDPAECLTLDSDGYPTLFHDDAAQAFTIIAAVNKRHYENQAACFPPRTDGTGTSDWIISWDGGHDNNFKMWTSGSNTNGNCTAPDLTFISKHSTLNRITYRRQDNCTINLMYLWMDALDSITPPTNISVHTLASEVTPGDASTVPLYSTEYIDAVSRFNVVRFMAWGYFNVIRQDTAAATLAKQCVWANRTQESNFRWRQNLDGTDAGPPYEAQIDLVEQILADTGRVVKPWFNVPDCAPIAYITSLIDLELDAANRPFYIERGNEIWAGVKDHYGANTDHGSGNLKDFPDWCHETDGVGDQRDCVRQGDIDLGTELARHFGTTADGNGQYFHADYKMVVAGRNLDGTGRFEMNKRVSDEFKDGVAYTGRAAPFDSQQRVCDFMGAFAHSAYGSFEGLGSSWKTDPSEDTIDGFYAERWEVPGETYPFHVQGYNDYGTAFNGNDCKAGWDGPAGDRDCNFQGFLSEWGCPGTEMIVYEGRKLIGDAIRPDNATEFTKWIDIMHSPKVAASQLNQMAGYAADANHNGTAPDDRLYCFFSVGQTEEGGGELQYAARNCIYDEAEVTVEDGGLGSSPMWTALVETDDDGDGFPDSADNCTSISNTSGKGPLLQHDVDVDGFGNICDGDYDQNGLVNGADFVIFRAGFNASASGITDHDGNGFTNGADYMLFRDQFLRGTPGPSGIVE